MKTTKTTTLAAAYSRREVEEGLARDAADGWLSCSKNGCDVETNPYRLNPSLSHFYEQTSTMGRCCEATPSDECRSSRSHAHVAAVVVVAAAAAVDDDDDFCRWWALGKCQQWVALRTKDQSSRYAVRVEWNDERLKGFLIDCEEDCDDLTRWMAAEERGHFRANCLVGDDCRTARRLGEVAVFATAASAIFDDAAIAIATLVAHCHDERLPNVAWMFPGCFFGRDFDRDAFDCQNLLDPPKRIDPREWAVEMKSDESDPCRRQLDRGNVETPEMRKPRMR